MKQGRMSMIDKGSCKFINIVAFVMVIFSLVGCSDRSNSVELLPPSPEANQITSKTYKDLVVGFSQIGAESEWPNSKSPRMSNFETNSPKQRWVRYYVVNWSVSTRKKCPPEFLDSKFMLIHPL